MPARKYPWEKWFNRRRRYKLVRGQDFTCQPHSMSVQIRAAAHLYGVRVSVSILDDVLLVTNY
jgi:hypothetical protein